MMDDKDKIPPMMIDGKMVDFSKLSMFELDVLKEELEKRQEKIRQELYGMLEE